MNMWFTLNYFISINLTFLWFEFAWANVDVFRSEIFRPRFGLQMHVCDEDFELVKAIQFADGQRIFKSFFVNFDPNKLNGTIVDLHPNSSMASPQFTADPYALQRVWVLANSPHNRDLLRRSDLQFDSQAYLMDAIPSLEDLVQISEVYKISSNASLTERVIETWSNGTNKLDLNYIWKRRMNLGGLHMRVGAIDFLSMIHLHNTTDEATGFCAELMKLLSRSMNFQYEYIQPKRNIFGSYSENAEWTGLAGLLIRNEVDLTANLVTMTYERSFEMNFSRGITMEQSVFVYQDFYGTAIPLQRIFAKEVIVIFVVIFVVLMLISILISYLYRKGRLFHIYILEVLLITLASVINQGFTERLSVISMRILLFTALLLGLLFVQVLSARLASLVSVHVEDDPINTFEAILEHEYDLYALGQSTREEFFSQANQGSSAWKIWHNQMSLSNHFHPPNLSMMMENALENPRSAIWINPVVYKHWAIHNREQSCKLNIKRERRSIHQAFGVRKDWPYLLAMNYQILKFLELGLIHQLQLEHHYPQHLEPHTYCPRKDEEQKRVGIRDVKAYWYVLSCGIGVGFILFLGEIIGKRRKTYKKLLKYMKRDRKKPKGITQEEEETEEKEPTFELANLPTISPEEFPNRFNTSLNDDPEGN